MFRWQYLLSLVSLASVSLMIGALPVGSNGTANGISQRQVSRTSSTNLVAASSPSTLPKVTDLPSLNNNITAALSDKQLENLWKKFLTLRCSKLPKRLRRSAEPGEKTAALRRHTDRPDLSYNEGFGGIGRIVKRGWQNLKLRFTNGDINVRAAKKPSRQDAKSRYHDLPEQLPQSLFATPRNAIGTSSFSKGGGASSIGHNHIAIMTCVWTYYSRLLAYIVRVKTIFRFAENSSSKQRVDLDEHWHQQISRAGQASDGDTKRRHKRNPEYGDKLEDYYVPTVWNGGINASDLYWWEEEEMDSMIQVCVTLYRLFYGGNGTHIFTSADNQTMDDASNIPSLNGSTPVAAPAPKALSKTFGLISHEAFKYKSEYGNR